MSLINSFKYALTGLVILTSERNFRIHLCLAIATMIAGWYWEISRLEWIAVIVCTSMVLTAEGFNTAVEQICDRITTDRDQSIKIIKDVSAAAVLITAIGSAVVGMLIFLPKII